jgi:hypothetical protein
VRDFSPETLIRTGFKFESRLSHPIIAQLDIHLTRQNVGPFSAPIAAVVQQGSHLPGIINAPGLPSPGMPIQGYPPQHGYPLQPEYLPQPGYPNHLAIPKHPHHSICPTLLMINHHLDVLHRPASVNHLLATSHHKQDHQCIPHHKSELHPAIHHHKEDRLVIYRRKEVESQAILRFKKLLEFFTNFE